MTLFIRYNGGVRLTPAGQRFLVQARKALSQIGNASIDAASFGRGETGTVRIGIFSSLASGFLADLLRAYVSSHPAIRLDLIEGATSQHIAAIQRHQLDVAFTTGQPLADGCDTLQLWEERIYVVLPDDDELSRKSEIEWSDLRERHFIVSADEPGSRVHNYLVKHLAELGRNPSIDRHDVARDNLMHLVAIGLGLTITSEATVAAGFPGVVYRPLIGAMLPFLTIWSPQNDNPALRRLLSLAKTMAGRSLPGSASIPEASRER